jgi:hypothetical protein
MIGNIFNKVAGAVGNAVGKMVEDTLSKMGVDPQIAKFLGTAANVGINVAMKNYAGVATELAKLAQDPRLQQLIGQTVTYANPADRAAAGVAVRDHRAGESHTTHAHPATRAAASGAPTGMPVGSEDPKEWTAWASDATWPEIEAALDGRQIPDKVLEDPMFQLQLQRKMQAYNRMFELMKNVMTAQHDTAKSAINAIRV